MKAIILTQYGSKDSLQLQDIEKPVPKDNEVLIHIHATSVNDWDWCLMRGTPFYIRLFCGLFKPNVRIAGAEVAGRIEVIGPNVTKFRPGDAVYGDISEAGFGGFAEYVCIPEDALVPKPNSMTFTEAAAIPHAAMLALQGLQATGVLESGQKILINGAGGGVGTLGVQIAKAMGATDITGVDSGEKLAMMRSLGFTQTIDYMQEDFTESEERYDLILDTKTNRSIFKYLQVLRPGGQYITVGGATPRLIQILFLSPIIRWFSQRQVKLVALKPNKDLGYINKLFESGQMKPIIDGPYPLPKVPEAVQYFGDGQHQGKVIITVGSPHHEQ